MAGTTDDPVAGGPNIEEGEGWDRGSDDADDGDEDINAEVQPPAVTPSRRYIPDQQKASRKFLEMQLDQDDYDTRDTPSIGI
jgi:hypothetical protein